MEEKLKKNLPYLIFLGTGILALLLLGWAFISAGGTPWGAFTVSGYGIMGIWSGFWGVMASLLQIFVLIDVLLLITVAIWGLVAANGKAKPLTLGKLGNKALGELGLTILTGLTLLIFICVLALSGGAVGFGLFLNFLLISGIFTTYMILWSKDIILQDGLFIRSTEKRTAQPRAKAKKAKVVEVEAEVIEVEAEVIEEEIDAAEGKKAKQVKQESPAEKEEEEETQTVSFNKKEK